MKPRSGTWAEVKQGVVIQDPKLKHWLVTGNWRPDGTIEIMSSTKELRWVPMRPPETPVVIMEVTEPEAIMLLGEGLGAHVLSRANDNTLPLRAMRFRMDPINTRGSGAKERIRDHIDIHHGVYVNDNWANKATKQLVQEHEEMHSEEHMTMTIPHHHQAPS